MTNDRTCSESECDRPSWARGLCRRHYQAAARRQEFQPAPKVTGCSEPDCEREPVARGLCHKHYQRFRRPKPKPKQPKTIQLCSELGCTGKHYARGICKKHYQRSTYTRHPRSVKPKQRKPSEPKPIRICSEHGCDERHKARGLCRKHYQAGRQRIKAHVVIKRGFDWELEEQAAALLRADRLINGGWKHSDWLTDAQLQARQMREVFNKNGFPDENIMEGRVFRAYNPLFGTRPKRFAEAV